MAEQLSLFEPTRYVVCLVTAMKLAALLLLCACSSRPELAVPPDAGEACRVCWADCGRVTSRKAASFCAIECNRICEEEAK